MNTRKKNSKPSPLSKLKGRPKKFSNGATSTTKGKDIKKDFPAAEVKTDVKEEKSKLKSKPHFKQRERKGDPMPKFNEDEIRLNKFLSTAGVASRREADVLIQSGVISVNDKIITELGFKIHPGDVVKYDGETIQAEQKRYVLLNKPKDFITTMDDPLGRKTVMSLVHKACKERIYPVGRLDRDTTGVLLFTNDGDLAKKLTHPRYKAVKIYHVELHKTFTSEDAEKLRKGIYLEDGKIECDKLEFIPNTGGREIGVEIHSGRNRIVRRMFEALGYTVVKLDRVQFAGLTKKDLPRSYYRHLTEQEVGFLKMS